MALGETKSFKCFDGLRKRSDLTCSVGECAAAGKTSQSSRVIVASSLTMYLLD